MLGMCRLEYSSCTLIYLMSFYYMLVSLVSNGIYKKQLFIPLTLLIVYSRLVNETLK